MDLQTNYIGLFIPFSENDFLSKLQEINSNYIWPDGTSNYCDAIVFNNVFYMIILPGFEQFFTEDQLLSAVEYNPEWRQNDTE